MENINDCISSKFKHMHNYSHFGAKALVFDNRRTSNKYSNIIDKVFNRLYSMDTEIYEKIQNDILNPEYDDQH